LFEFSENALAPKSTDDNGTHVTNVRKPVGMLPAAKP
jgi:hypothetical protein